MGASSAVPGTADRIVGPHPPRTVFVSPPAARIEKIVQALGQTDVGPLIETIPSLDFHTRDRAAPRARITVIDASRSNRPE